MNLSDITLLTCTYNRVDMVEPCVRSIFKSLGRKLPVVVINTGEEQWFPGEYVDVCTVVNNAGHRLMTMEEMPDRCRCQPSDCHSASLDWCLKNAIHTRYAMMTDTDVIYYPNLKEFLETVDEHDAIGEIGHLRGDCRGRRQDRLYPHFCLINVERMKRDGISFFDKDRCAGSDPCPGDTGCSFRMDIEAHGWDILRITASDYCTHLKGATWQNKNYRRWASTIRSYWQ